MSCYGLFIQIHVIEKIGRGISKGDKVGYEERGRVPRGYDFRFPLFQEIINWDMMSDLQYKFIITSFKILLLKSSYKLFVTYKFIYKL